MARLRSYAEAKSRLFQFPSLKVAVINLDDEHAGVMIQAAKNNPAQPKILTYSTTQPADYQVKNIQYSLTGANFSCVRHRPNIRYSTHYWVILILKIWSQV